MNVQKMTALNVYFLTVLILILHNVLLETVVGKPTFSSFSSRFSNFLKRKGPIGFSKPARSTEQENQTQVKPYSGIRVSNMSIVMVYYYDQTIAIAEIGPGKLLLNCELIEVIEPEGAVKTLKELSSMSRPLEITLEEMITLMGQCQMLDDPSMPTSRSDNSFSPETALASRETTKPGLFANSPFTIFNGIVPGTKWCGTGDIAKNFHDLGADFRTDKCCRTHDICPVKIHAYSTRYNITNQSLYTKSHCACDDMLYDCLKKSNSSTADILGNIYFNIVQIPCLEDKDNTRRFRKAKNNF